MLGARRESLTRKSRLVLAEQQVKQCHRKCQAVKVKNTTETWRFRERRWRVQNFLSMELMKEHEKPSAVTHTLNSSTQDAEARGPWIQGQLELHSEFKDSVGSISWPCLKTQKPTRQQVSEKDDSPSWILLWDSELGTNPTDEGWEEEARRKHLGVYTATQER